MKSMFVTKEVIPPIAPATIIQPFNRVIAKTAGVDQNKLNSSCAEPARAPLTSLFLNDRVNSSGSHPLRSLQSSRPHSPSSPDIIERSLLRSVDSINSARSRTNNDDLEFNRGTNSLVRPVRIFRSSELARPLSSAVLERSISTSFDLSRDRSDTFTPSLKPNGTRVDTPQSTVCFAAKLSPLESILQFRRDVDDPELGLTYEQIQLAAVELAKEREKNSLKLGTSVRYSR